MVVAFLTGCDRSEKASDADSASHKKEPYQVLCTVGMITDIVRNIVGDYAQVEGIIGEGVDPHLYQPTRSDVVKLSTADVVFYNGLLLEGKMTNVLMRVAKSGKPVKAVTEAILENSDYLLQKEEDSKHIDPHVWMDVRGWMQAVPLVAETLSIFDPLRADIYTANATAYTKKLEALDAYAQQSIGSIPESQRVLVTAHDAFNYLGRATGLTVRGIQGVSTESEAGVRDLEDLVNYIVEKKIPAVFVETSVADKNVRALVEGANARGHGVRIGGALFSDAMGQAGTYEGTYIGMIDSNITTITRALGGEAPELGMQGKLTGVVH
ncbi:MAG: zinc ABC transporter solute-binding protein [Opitutae bacterium]|nr:zinc ABC transporter solute-binding protein [Opitutae bacterium]